VSANTIRQVTLSSNAALTVGRKNLLLLLQQQSQFCLLLRSRVARGGSHEAIYTAASAIFVRESFSFASAFRFTPGRKFEYSLRR